MRLLPRLGVIFAVILLTLETTQAPGQINRPLPSAAMASEFTSAGQSDSPTSTGPMVYSRVYLPMARIAAVPGSYLPVTQARFDRMVAEAEARNPPRSTSRVATARYVARFAGGELIDGLANLRIEHESAELAAVPLGACGLSIGAPRWMANSSANQEAATVGMTPNQELVAIADRSGSLEFDWSLRGRRQAASTFAFSVQLPRSVDSTIELLIPDPLEVTSRQGIITQQADSPQTNRWTIQCGSVGRIDLVIAPRQTVTNPSATSLYAESTTYRMALDGVSFQSRMELEVLQSPINGLTLQVPARVAVTTATIDGVTVPLDVINEPQDATRRWNEIRLDRSIAAGIHEVVVEGLASCEPGVLWELPRIRPNGVVWRRGTAIIEVQRPLSATRLELNGCWQRDVVRPSDDKNLLTRTFELYGVDARIQIRVDVPESRLHLRQGTTITLGGPTTTAVAILGITASRGERFKLTADVHPEWVVDGVQLSNPELLEDWQVMPTGEDGQELEIRLRQPLEREQAVRVTVVAHRGRLFPEERVQQEELRVIHLQDVQLEDDLFCIRCLNNQQLRVSGDSDIRPLDSLELVAKDATLVSAKRGDFTFRAPDNADGLSYFYVEGTPVWHSRLETTARINRDSLDESYRIEVTPEAAAIERVVVRIQPSRTGAIRWELAGIRDQQLAARRLEEGSDTSNIESWEVMLPDSKRTSMTIVGHRFDQLREGPFEICVLSTPAAKSERSVVTVVAASEAFGYFTIESELPQLPLTGELAGNPFTVGRYLASAATRIQRRVTVHPSKTPRIGAWIARSLQHTRLSPQGAMLHETNLLVENYGQSSFKVTLPIGSAMRRLTVNDQFVAVTESALEHSVPMNPKDREVKVAIEYSQSGTPLGSLDSLDLPQLTTSLPVLQRRLSISVPPDWEFWGDVASAYESWTVRLFGWLARTAHPVTLASRTTLTLDNPEIQRVQLFHRRVWGLAGWLVSCLAILFVTLQSRFTAVQLAMLIAACPLACLLVPLPLVPVVRGILWGGLAGVVARRIPHPHFRGTRSWRSRWTTAHIALVIMTVCQPSFRDRARAEEPATGSKPSTYRVLIPDDAADNDPYVFLPAEMYQELVRRSELHKSPLETWVIRSFRYRARLSSANDGDTPTLGTVEVTAQLYAFGPGQLIAFPLPAHGSDWQISQVTVNGEQLAWEYGTDARNLRLQLSQAGDQEVQYLLQPPVTPASTVGCDLPMVPHPDSTLELSISRDDLLPVVNNRVGRAFPLEESRRQVFELGACAAAEIRWNAPAENIVEEPCELQLLGWLQIDPGAVTCDIALLSSDQRPLPRTIRLDLGPSLRPLNSPSHPFDHLEDQTNRRLLELDTQAQSIVRLRCLVTNGVGLGELNLPDVHAVDATIVRSIWAGTVHPSLSFEQTLDRDALSLTPDEFVRAWRQPVAGRPDFVVSPVREAMRWRLKTFPRRSISVAETSARIVYSATTASIDFEARIAPLEGQHFLHQLAAPPAVEIQSLEVEEEGVRQPISWTRDDTGMIHIMLDSAVGGKHQIHLKGSLPLSNWGRNEVPMITVSNGQIWSHEITIWRDSTVSVELLVEESLQPLSLSEEGTEEQGLYLVAALLSDGESRPQAIVNLQPNQPNVQGQLATIMRNTAGRWWADVDWSLTFTGGVPDEFVLESTPDWGEALEIRPPVEARMEELRDGRRQIIVRPDLDRTAGEFHLMMSGPLTPAAQVASPSLRLRGHPNVARLLVLPKQVQGHSLNWEVQHATRLEDVSEQFTGPRIFHRDADCYLLEQADAGGMLPILKSTVRPARLLFADVRLDATDRLTIGDVRLLVHPRGSRFAELRIPPGCTIVATLVDERLAETSSIDDELLRVSLGPSQLPQQIRLLWRLDSQAVKSQRATRTLSVPTLASSDASENLWSLSRGQTVTAADPTNLRTLSHDEALRLRLGVYEATLGEAGDALSNYSTEELAAWFARWAKTILALAFECDAAANDATHEHELTMRVAGSLRRDAMRLGLSETDVPALLDLDLSETLEVSEISGATPDHTTYASSTESSRELRVIADEAQPARRAKQRSVFAMLLLIGVAACCVTATPAIRSQLTRWLHLVPITIGFLWIVLLRIPTLGWLLILVGLGTSLFVSKFRTRRSEQTESSD